MYCIPLQCSVLDCIASQCVVLQCAALCRVVLHSVRTTYLPEAKSFGMSIISYSLLHMLHLKYDLPPPVAAPPCASSSAFECDDVISKSARQQKARAAAGYRTERTLVDCFVLFEGGTKTKQSHQCPQADYSGCVGRKRVGFLLIAVQCSTCPHLVDPEVQRVHHRRKVHIPVSHPCRMPRPPACIQRRVNLALCFDEPCLL